MKNQKEVESKGKKSDRQAENELTRKGNWCEWNDTDENSEENQNLRKKCIKIWTGGDEKSAKKINGTKDMKNQEK